MKKKRDYKTIQLGFNTKADYEKFHKKAVKTCGFDNRNVDCMYLRECIKIANKDMKTAIRKKVISLVEMQETMNEILKSNASDEVKDKIYEFSEEAVKTWVY